jgi:hypothetical protein
LYIALESKECQNKFPISFTHIHTETKIKVAITYNNIEGSGCGVTSCTVLEFFVEGVRKFMCQDSRCGGEHLSQTPSEYRKY